MLPKISTKSYYSFIVIRKYDYFIALRLHSNVIEQYVYFQLTPNGVMNNYFRTSEQVW